MRVEVCMYYVYIHMDSSFPFGVDGISFLGGGGGKEPAVLLEIES